MMPWKKKMTTVLSAAAIVLFIIAFAAWWYLFFGKPNPPLKRADVSVGASAAGVSSDTGAASAAQAPVDGENPPLGEERLGVDGATFSVEIASTTLEQARGLSFRPSLGGNDGMLFIFAGGSVQTFWMKDMNFPLDMIWISGNTVVGFAQDVPAPAPGTALWSLPVYSSPDKTDKVLEVNAGTVAKYNIKVGDVVTIGPAN